MFGGGPFGGFGGGMASQRGGGFFAASQDDAKVTALLSNKQQQQKAFYYTTIRQIFEPSDLLNPASFGATVQLLGMVMSVTAEEARMRYLLTDWTHGNFIEITKYFEGMQSEPFPLGTFVSVIGTVRQFGNDTSISCHRIVRLENANEISRHLIGVVWSLNQVDTKPQLPALPALSAFPASVSKYDFHENLKRQFQDGFTKEQAVALLRQISGNDTQLDQFIDELKEENYLYQDYATGKIRFCY